MSDRAFLAERLGMVLEWLERIPPRFAGISRAEDFLATADGLMRMDAICMMLVAAGEELKNIDDKTHGELFSRYPGADWHGAMRVRDVLAHGYFRTNPLQLFAICRDDIPPLITTLRQLIDELEHF
jgi:uncharacterized protein with HEPN domain